MEFPGYVPAAVRVYITALLNGDKWEPQGFAASLASAEQQLSEIEQALEMLIRRREIEHLEGLRRQKTEAIKRRDWLAGDVDCLRRLIHDGRMQNAYALLTFEFSADEQWRGFVHAAWAARVDFKDYREGLKRAVKLKDEIADVADTLAKLIRQFSQTGVNGPGEFYSVPELLRNTDNHESGGHYEIWRAMRKHVLGDRQKQEPGSDNQHELALLSESDRIIEVKGMTDHRLHIHFVSPDEPVEPDPLAALRYGWEKAPPFSALLKTVAKAARNFMPEEGGFIGEAISSRKHNPRIEYLRAFAYLLTHHHKINLTQRVIQAMTIATNVAVNDPDFDVTVDDALKAL